MTMVTVSAHKPENGGATPPNVKQPTSSHFFER